MVNSKNIEKLESSLLKSSPILFLGAGFSRDSVCNQGTMPTGNELRIELLKNFINNIPKEDIEEIKSYDLKALCECIASLSEELKTKLRNYLTERFSNVYPNKQGFHNYITKYPWRKIYTVNIDDLLENIYTNAGLDYHVINSGNTDDGKKLDIVSLNAKTEIIKLHGCVRNDSDGYIFSSSEYTDLISKKLDLRLNNFVMDLTSNDVIFVGTSLDEPDVEYYLSMYEKAGYKKLGKIFFIEPKPSLKLKQKAQKLEAEIIPWTNSEFMHFISELNYNPEISEKMRITLNYNAIHRLEDTTKIFEKVYESSIYEGFNCTWQDVSEEWVYTNDNYQKAREKLFQLLKEQKKIKCFSIYGEAFSGKSCLLKQLGYEISKDKYEVLEFKGKDFNKSVLKEYINESAIKKIALIIDNASYYYRDIEQILNWDIQEKELLIICAARTFYHKKKKYYLEGNCYYEFKCNDLISRGDAEVIDVILENKSSLSNFNNLSKKNRINAIYKNKSISNLILELTYGIGLKKRVIEEMGKLKNLNAYEKQLLLEVAIFDSADIEYYPADLFTLKYGNLVQINGKIDTEKLKIVDYLKWDDVGISLRNNIFHKSIIKQNKDKIVDTIIDILVYISKFVKENKNDIWKIIFQSLAQTIVLKERYKLNSKDIKTVLYGIKEKYKSNSYYWLQLGLLEQSDNEFSKAQGHFINSLKIRPNSFKLQHALARNYLKHANFEENFEIAHTMFLEGEKQIKDLINSDEYYKKKAKSFSIHTLVEEKSKFILKFDYKASNSELRYLIKLLEETEVRDEYFDHAARQLYKALKKINKTSLISGIGLDSPFIDIIKEI